MGMVHTPTREAASQWLAWARHNHHSEGCHCHGCVKARRHIAGQLTVVSLEAFAGLGESAVSALFGQRPVAAA